jgi:hypothetical protein
MIHALPALVALWLVDPNATPPMTPAERFAEGRTLYDRGRYLEAAEIFVRLHSDTGEVSVLYAAGQSFRLAGKCQDALAAYEAFVSAADSAHPRTKRVPLPSDDQRATSDVDLARARVIEMRVCANRSHSGLVRERAGGLTKSDPAAALAILENEWQQTRDPTILPPLARLQRRMGACDRAATSLDAGIDAVGSIETLADAALPNSDVGTARDTLNELQRLKTDEHCVPVTVTIRDRRESPPFTPIADVSDRSAPARARWPTWAMGGAAVLIVAGGVSGALMYRTQNELDVYGQENRLWDSRGSQLYQDGQRYQLGAVVLTTTGIVMGATALFYRALSRAGGTSNRQTASRSAVLRSIGSF